MLEPTLVTNHSAAPSVYYIYLICMTNFRQFLIGFDIFKYVFFHYNSRLFIVGRVEMYSSGLCMFGHLLSSHVLLFFIRSQHTITTQSVPRELQFYIHTTFLHWYHLIPIMCYNVQGNNSFIATPKCTAIPSLTKLIYKRKKDSPQPILSCIVIDHRGFLVWFIANYFWLWEKITLWSFNRFFGARFQNHLSFEGGWVEKRLKNIYDKKPEVCKVVWVSTDLSVIMGGWWSVWWHLRN